MPESILEERYKLEPFYGAWFIVYCPRCGDAIGACLIEDADWPLDFNHTCLDLIPKWRHGTMTPVHPRMRIGGTA